ncbi:hypothetical protein SDC9_83174 [bioreactor metagenome]|uniref:Uncharacterized protein n=1 Tax=bioreactor metagenome TaxID=1076179 RepID=A0A644Z6R2_9ZZZZ
MGVIIRPLLPWHFFTPLSWSVLFVLIEFYLVLKLFVGRPEPCGLHSQGIKHLLLEIYLPLHPCDDLNNSCTNVNSRIGIELAGTGLEHDGRCGGDGGCLAKRSSSRPSATPDVGALGTNFEGEASSMVEHHTDGKDVFGLTKGLDTVICSIQHP